MELQRSGETKIRTRALTTTLFARLFLSDLFIHGLGGAIYDQITDELICRFYEAPVPDFATLSATVYLPVDRPTAGPEEAAKLKQRLRLLLYNPQKALPPAARHDPAVAELVRRKESLIQWHPQTRRERRARFEEFRAINRQLSQLLIDEIERLRAQLTHVEQQIAVRRILENREYPFCVYPGEYLAAFYDEFCQRIGSAETLPSR